MVFQTEEEAREQTIQQSMLCQSNLLFCEVNNALKPVSFRRHCSGDHLKIGFELDISYIFISSFLITLRGFPTMSERQSSVSASVSASKVAMRPRRIFV